MPSRAKTSLPNWLWLAGALLALAACKRAEPPAADVPVKLAPAPATAAQPTAPEPAPIRVAAASDLTAAFEELGRVFEQAHPEQKLSFTFGSSGLLAKQVSEGAPFDLFASANVAFVDDVVAAGACDGATRAPYARGRIAIWSRKDTVAAPRSLADLADKRFVRIAIAQPEHAPYGKAAREALIATKVWPRVEKRVVYGENIRQTLQLAESGNAEAAIVALSLVINDKQNSWLLVDDKLHGPIDQALVVCRHGANASGGRAFAELVNGAAGRPIMKRYGFTLPNEAEARAP